VKGFEQPIRFIAIPQHQDQFTDPLNRERTKPKGEAKNKPAT
jgi:hypothetical protein